MFLSFIIDPYYLVEKTAEERPSLQKVRSYYSWNAEGETLQLLHKEDKSYFKYGTIISVSPSRRYCLLLGVDGVSKKKQLTIWDIDMDKLVSNCYIDACNVNNPFAGFSWDEENNRILYLLKFHLILAILPVLVVLQPMDVRQPGLQIQIAITVNFTVMITTLILVLRACTHPTLLMVNPLGLMLQPTIHLVGMKLPIMSVWMPLTPFLLFCCMQI